MFIDRPDIPSGIKIAAQTTPEPTADDIAFVKQMGVDYVVLWTDGAHASYDYYASRRKLFAENGLTVYGFGSWAVHNQPVITLGLPGRDEKIEEYKQHLRNLGKSRDSLHDLRPHGQRHLEFRTGDNPRWGSGPRLQRQCQPQRSLDRRAL